jgi:cytochrome c biogenesis protein ResB
MLDFEKVSEQHILSVQRDPGANVVYVGFVMLFITLAGVFFFSHQRVWASVRTNTPDKCEVIIAGNTNRNRAGLEDRVERLAKSLIGGSEVNTKQ